MIIVLYFIPFYLLIGPTLSWNIETRFPVTFSGKKNSYFGFSVALHDNSKGNFALVTATKANSTFPDRRKLHQPGILYKCNITTRKCDEVVFEREDIVRSLKNNTAYTSKEDNMWLGVSLDVRPAGNGEIVTCAHLWKNAYFKNHYLSNGACYVIDREFNEDSIRTLLPLITNDKQTVSGIFYNAFAQAGTSATFSEDGDLVLGAPGFYDWIGTVINYKLPDNPAYFPSFVVPEPPSDPTTESYIGYSVSTGRFLKSGIQQFVAGAPRDAINRGRVYIFEALHREQKSIIVLQKFEGEKVGEYFGACILGADINSDSYADLLVGSPFYSLPSGGDEGKVYVYMSTGMGLQKSQELMGSRKTESRFGTAIANAGDLNQDGYLDVAIGAPYEDNRGAVYIYHGSSNGILPNYVQKIDARRIDTSLLGFGISISRGKDIDKNYYPDLLVGSYISSQAVLFRTRPVVRVHANMTFSPSQINTNSSLCPFDNNLLPCFNVSFCLNYTGNYVPLELDISIELSSARTRDVVKLRRYLIYKNQLSSYLRKNVTLKKGESQCFPHPAYVNGDSDDYITPIQMTLTFKLTHDVTSEETFCKFCPVLDPTLPSHLSRTITFQTGCADTNICISDLRLTANVLGLSSGEIIVGQTNVIILTIELQNYKEPAYMTEIHISLPNEVQITNQGHCQEDLSNHDVITCEAGNPLRIGQIVRHDIKFDTSSVSSEFDHITINVAATTASNEDNKHDNEVRIDIPLKILADITIIGRADVEQIIIGKDKPDAGSADIVHVYTVLKFLPTPISSVLVEMFIPTMFSKSNISFIQLKSIGINEISSSPVPASCNFSQVDLHPDSAEFEEKKEVSLDIDTFIIPTPSPKRAITKRSAEVKTKMLDAIETSASSDDGHSKSYVLKCSNSKCSKISCLAGPFTQRSTSASFHISGFVNITSLQKVLDGWDNVIIVTEGKVTIPNPRENVQPKNHRPDEAKVNTTLVHATLPPAKRIAIWIVAVSVAAGVLLLVLILLGLIKLGFFHRQKKEDMERMLTKAKLEMSEPCTDTDETEGATDIPER